MSWRVTLRCTRAEAEALPDSADLFAHADEPPVIVADEPDPHAPDDWRIHAYFAEQPTTQELVLLRRLAANSEPEIEHLEDTTDWVTMSQQGLGPIRAGRFFVHTPMHYADRPAGTVNFEIDAGLAFGTGQHDTTAGCLAALDRLERRASASPTSPTSAPAPACSPSPRWRCGPRRRRSPPTSTTSRSRSARKMPRSTASKLGHGPGELLLAVADGMDHPLITARAPYDLLIANILAGPLIELAPRFRRERCARRDPGPRRPARHPGRCRHRRL